MRDLASCFSENSINISHPSCSSYSNTSCISPILTPSVQNSLTCLYKITLSTQTHHLITINWFKTQSSQTLTIYFSQDPSSLSFKLNTNSRLFRKLKGAKLYESENSKTEIFWDLSNAKYNDSSPEPVNGFYVLIMVDSEIGLILGDMAEEAVRKKFKSDTHVAKATLISRREHFSGNTIYSTKARFCDEGSEHEILIRFSGENDQGLKYPVLSVCIDKKTAIRVKRLQWNFRGNQTIFVDGLLVDLLWDVHDWFFSNNGSGNIGYGVFLFRTRSGLDSRLWLEEKMIQKDEECDGFSLFIYATRTS